MVRLLGAAILVVAASADGPCCKKCELPLVKYYSVDVAHGFCGDVCADPKKFSIYKVFEANLTLVDDEHPGCSGQYTPDGKFYTDYDSTVSHGDPFGILAVMLDLYAPTGMPDHSCCSTPLPFRINCGGKPKSMKVRGTGPYCCPASATEDEPCKKEIAIAETKEVARDERTTKMSAKSQAKDRPHPCGPGSPSMFRCSGVDGCREDKWCGHFCLPRSDIRHTPQFPDSETNYGNCVEHGWSQFDHSQQFPGYYGVANFTVDMYKKRDSVSAVPVLV